jgi:chromosome partitioning protein
MKRLVIANQKGGVGKTTIGVHIAYRLAELGRQVLFIDIDPQGNSSKTLRAHHGGVAGSQLFAAEPVAPTRGEGITLIAADARLVDIERADTQVVRHFLAQLRGLDAQPFDVCVIDTPPTMGLRLTAALMAADHVLAPIELEEYSLDGIEKLLKTVIGVRQQYNARLNFLGMLPNKFNPNSLRQKAAMQQLLTQFAPYLIPAKIGIRAGIPEALAAGMPVWRLKKTAAREAGVELKAALDLVFARMGEAV